MTRPTNLLFIFSDEHTRDITGCYGHKTIKTPNIDKLAARGTRFTSAYTSCPICVPARTALHTGTHVHQTGSWDNAHGYDGKIPGWAHRLRDQGHRGMSIGKLHFRSVKDDHGFDPEVIPLHIVDELGDLLGCIRRPIPAERGNIRGLARDLGPGPSTYADYDNNITEAACEWLKTRAKADKKPWTMFISLVKPHFPLICPPEWFKLYDPAKMEMPRLYAAEDRPMHPVIQGIRRCMNYDDFFFSHDQVKLALANYFGMVSFLDHNIGRILAALEESGLAGDTRVIYTSDHGDNLGTRGMWGKSVHYEEACAIPLIMAGPEIPAGAVNRTPVTLVDMFPTILECNGVAPTAEDKQLPGTSLFELIKHEDPERVALSEYHAAASITAMYMVRKGRWKYVHHVGYAPQLFDLQDDPGETVDLGESPAHAPVREALERELRKILDPEAVCAKALADQAAKVAANGGERAVRKRGDFGYSPVPGQKASFG